MATAHLDWQGVTWTVEYAAEIHNSALFLLVVRTERSDGVETLDLLPPLLESALADAIWDEANERARDALN